MRAVCESWGLRAASFARIDADVKALRADLQAVDAKIANLTAAIENGAAVAPIVTQLERRQKEREGLLMAIAATEARQSLAVDRRVVEETILAEVHQWRTFLTSEPDVRGTRQFLRELLEGPLTFTPEGKAYRFEGAASPDRLLGQAGLPPLGTSPRGSGHLWGCEVRRVVQLAA